MASFVTASSPVGQNICVRLHGAIVRCVIDCSVVFLRATHLGLRVSFVLGSCFTVFDNVGELY